VATEALREQIIPLARTRPMADRIFFSTMIVVLWATVLYGFSKTYYMAGMTNAPLPNHLVHIHGAIMTLWMLVQKMHRCGQIVQPTGATGNQVSRWMYAFCQVKNFNPLQF